MRKALNINSQQYKIRTTQHMSSNVASVTILIVRSIPDDAKPVAMNCSFGWVLKQTSKKLYSSILCPTGMSK
jgi:hypothetical protein